MQKAVKAPAINVIYLGVVKKRVYLASRRGNSRLFFINCIEYVGPRKKYLELYIRVIFHNIFTP